LQRISAGERHHLTDWDIYIHQELVTFHVNWYSWLGATPFYPQHGTEPVLLSTSVVLKLIIPLEIAEAVERRQKQCSRSLEVPIGNAKSNIVNGTISTKSRRIFFPRSHPRRQSGHATSPKQEVKARL
jgi:hypothetical protein